MNIIEILRAARALIDTEDKWTKKSFAVDECGMGIPTGWSDAEKFCIVGAIDRVFIDNNLDMVGVKKVMDHIEYANGSQYHDLIGFNDHPCTNHWDVMNVLDTAINTPEYRSWFQRILKLLYKLIKDT